MSDRLAVAALPNIFETETARLHEIPNSQFTMERTHSLKQIDFEYAGDVRYYTDQCQELNRKDWQV